MTLQDFFDRVDWGRYEFAVTDDRANVNYRSVLLYEAFYGEMETARNEAIHKLGDVYLDARRILEEAGLGYEA